MVKKPSVYVDTNICRDCIKRRSFDTIRLIGKITDKKWTCITSVFTLMELLDIEKEDLFAHKKIRLGWEINKIIRERKNKDLFLEELEEIRNQIGSFLETFPNISIRTLDVVGWNRALNLSGYSNLSAVDVIHLAVAWQSKCNVILTSDQLFIKHGNKILENHKVLKKMRVCEVSKMNSVLKEMGFKKID